MRKPSAAIIVAAIALGVSVTGVGVAAPSSHKAITASSRRGPRGYRGHRGPRGYPGSVGQITSVKSTQEVLLPDQTTYDVDPNGFQATCPSGKVVIGTGFDVGGVGQVGFVESYGNFVGGFISNPSSVTIQVELQGLCAAAGSDYANARVSTAHQSYPAMLRETAAAYRASH